jgi:predicted nucleic acid-binding protein
VLDGPVYLDANVLASFLVNGHPLYPSSAALIGDLLAGQIPIVLSDLVLTESLWALSHLAYCDAFGHTRYDVDFKHATYKRHHAAIFGSAHGEKVAAVVEFVRSLEDLHLLVVSHPKNSEWVMQVDSTHALMRSDRLLPGDATHLAIAEGHARTLVTADESLAKTGGVSPAKLSMVWLRPSRPARTARALARARQKVRPQRSGKAGRRQ